MKAVVIVLAVLLVLAMYGLHRSHLVLTVLRHGRTLRALKEGVPALPTGTVEGRVDLPHVTIHQRYAGDSPTTTP